MSALVLKGWTCACGIFNGEEKATRAICRTCDAPRPPQPDPSWVPQIGSRVSCPELDGLTAKVVGARLVIQWEDHAMVTSEWDVSRLRPAGEDK